MSEDRAIGSSSVPGSETTNRSNGLAARVWEWSAGHPVWSVVMVSLLAVAINCYPIVFCGRSYVSPPPGTPMLYSWYPPLPEMKQAVPAGQVHGSDAWATELWSVPVGFIESRSLLDHGELPLWNRYSHAGAPLLGQAVSMLGDPLQLMVILGRGSAGAWDLKFLTAKFLFCAGFGLLILRLTGSRPLALVYTALAAYCGAFFFINNHPVFFVFAYAPWILFTALAWLDPRSEHPVRLGLAWLLANFACFNAGHVEVAVDLIGGLNLAALVWALTAGFKAAVWARVLGRMAAGALFFLGLTAPVWLSFLVALQNSYSIHQDIKILQLPALMFPGAFDDLFYLLAKANDATALAPGASLLVMAGCILSGLRWRQLKSEYFFWINGGAILLWGGCVFGWVPAGLLAATPLLNRVSHIFTDFSFLLVMHLTIQSAYGFKCLAAENDFRRAAADSVWVILIFVGVMLGYCLGVNHYPIPWNYFACVSVGAVGAPLLYVFLKSRPRRISAIGWVGILALGFIPQFRFGLYHVADDTLLMVPGSRVVLDAPSPAINQLKTDLAGPFRVAGLDYNLFNDYAAVYDLENICSCEPLSNGEYIRLVRNFPGMNFWRGWMLRVTDPVKAQPLLNLLNVKYLLAPTNVTFGKAVTFRIADRSDFGIVENLEVWPRAFLANQVVPIASSEQFGKYLLANGRQPFAALTQTEIARLPGLQSLEKTGPAVITPATHYKLLPNATEFDVHASSAGVICLTEGQAKDFTAMANHQPKEVLTVNRAFKGIYLDQPGDYHIQFIYRPRYWRLGCTLFWLAAGGVIMLAILSLICVNGARQTPARPGNSKP